MKDDLHPLLLRLSGIIARGPVESDMAEIPALLARHMQASAVGVYMRHADRRFLLRWKYAEGFSGILRDAFTAPQTIRKAVCRDYTEHVITACPAQVLTLFLIHENEAVGMVSVIQDKQDADGQAQIALETAARLLTDIYHVFPAMKAMKERETSLLALYRKAEDDLDKYRRQVSMALHDEVGQTLTAVTIQINMLERSNDPEHIKSRLKSLSHITTEALNEVRKISRNLHPYLLEKMGLQVAIQANVKEYIQLTGIDVDFRCNDMDISLPVEIEEVLYRTSQEGLTNAARHSGAAHVSLTLSIKAENVLLQIVDNGKGFPADLSYGMGLTGMKERTRLVGGHFWICNDSVGGASVNVLLPLIEKGSQAL